MANILYIGSHSVASTSGHRAQALVRLGHAVDIIDPYKHLSGQVNSRWMGAIHFRTGYRFLSRKVAAWLEESTMDKSPDIVWVNSGELLGPSALQVLKGLKCPIVLYNNDDPTGNRDGRRFDSLLGAFPYYDLVVVRREKDNSELEALGAKRVLRVLMSYDEAHHMPFSSVDDIPKEFMSEVAFIGTWMRSERRDEFILALLEQQIPVSVWGNRWEKSPHFARLKDHWKGGALSGRNYVAALQGAKICLGMISKGNRDLHTRRSVETPFAGGLLCAERTSVHTEMYREGEEAVFWDDADECASVCKDLLVNDSKREHIRAAGRSRVLSLGVGNEDLCRRIIEAI
jgi:hypothetical protein